MTNTRVLIVEDDVGTQTILKRLVLNMDPQVHVSTALSAEVAYQMLNTAAGDGQQYDLVISDLLLPESDGLVLCDVAQKRHPGVQFLFVSSTSLEGWIDEIKVLPVWPPFIQKPVTEESFRTYWEAHFSPLGQIGS